MFKAKITNKIKMRQIEYFMINTVNIKTGLKTVNNDKIESNCIKRVNSYLTDLYNLNRLIKEGRDLKEYLVEQKNGQYAFLLNDNEISISTYKGEIDVEKVELKSVVFVDCYNCHYEVEVRTIQQELENF